MYRYEEPCGGHSKVVEATWMGTEEVLDHMFGNFKPAVIPVNKNKNYYLYKYFLFQ